MASSLPVGPGGKPSLTMESLLRDAQMHAETSDTRQWVDNLERMLAVAWDLMTEDQRQAFREHADILAIAEAAGEQPPAA